MKSNALLLLCVTSIAHKVSPATFGYWNRLAFIVRCGSQDSIEPESSEIVDSNVTLEPMDVNEDRIDSDEKSANAEGENIEDNCAEDACSTRGGATLSELIDDDILHTDNEEEISETKHDVNVVENVETPSRDHPAEALDSEGTPQVEEFADQDELVNAEAEKLVESNNDEAYTAAGVEDATDVRGGADVPESTESIEIDDTPVVDAEVEDEIAEVNGVVDDDDNGDDEPTGGDDPAAVRGGADAPESSDQIDNGQVPPAGEELAEEGTNLQDDGEDGQGDDDSTTVEDPTIVRGGADVPEPIDTPGEEQPSVKSASEDADDGKIDEVDGGGPADVNGTSVRGGAQNAPDSKDLTQDAESEYEDEDVDGEHGQFDADGDFYADEDDSSVVNYEVEEAEQIGEASITDNGEDIDEVFHAEDVSMEMTEERRSIFETEVNSHVIDDDSSAFVDREELADAYDDEPILGATSFRAGHTDDDDRASIDDVPRTDATAGINDFEPVQSETSLSDESESQAIKEDEEEEKDEDVSTVPADVDVISKEVEQILVNECGFRKSELRGMKPQIANVMADKRLQRPQEGIPESWYNEKKTGIAFATVRKILIAVIPIALGALVVLSGEEILKMLPRPGKSELLIGIEEEKPRKVEGELTIQGSESEDDSFDDDALEIPPPLPSSKGGRFRKSGGESKGNWLEQKLSSFKNRASSKS